MNQFSECFRNNLILDTFRVMKLLSTLYRREKSRHRGVKHVAQGHTVNLTSKIMLFNIFCSAAFDLSFTEEKQNYLSQ